MLNKNNIQIKKKTEEIEQLFGPQNTSQTANTPGLLILYFTACQISDCPLLSQHRSYKYPQTFLNIEFTESVQNLIEAARPLLLA